MKKILNIVIIKTVLLVLLLSGLFILTGCNKYDTSRDELIQSPNGKYSITLRYDNASRPYIFKDNKLIFETNKPGFNETVHFKVKWESENKILLYIDMDNEKYNNDKYYINID